MLVEVNSLSLSVFKGKVVLANTVLYYSLKNSIMHNFKCYSTKSKSGCENILWDSEFCYMKISGIVTGFFRINLLHQHRHSRPTSQLHKLKTGFCMQFASRPANLLSWIHQEGLPLSTAFFPKLLSSRNCHVSESL